MVKKKTSKWKRLKTFSKKVGKFGKGAAKEVGKGYGTFQRTVPKIQEIAGKVYTGEYQRKAMKEARMELPSMDSAFGEPRRTVRRSRRRARKVARRPKKVVTYY